MIDYRKRPNRVPWPPLIFGSAILIAWLLNRTWPLTHALEGSIALKALGIALALAGLFLDFWAMKTLHDHKTTVMPNSTSTQLVATGPFAFTRNPIYVGNTLLTFGLGFIFANGWILVAGIVAPVITHFLAVRREEAHLAAVFGEAYESYCRKVRRWL